MLFAYTNKVFILLLVFYRFLTQFTTLNFKYIKFFLLNHKMYGIMLHRYTKTAENGRIGVINMKCPYCSFEESKVIDSRPTDEGERIRRRRECLNCQKRFTTYEIIESLPIVVIKKDKSREVFNRDKLINGMLKACEKRPVSINDIERAVDDIEVKLQNSLDREVTSDNIGELVMEKLKGLDEVAYVRFASVYRQFKDLSTFMEELNKLLKDK